MKEIKKKRGVKPLNETALTAAQRKRRERARLAFSIEAAQDSGYTPMGILLNNKQLRACRELEISWGGDLSADKLNILIFMALKHFLEDDSNQHLKTPKLNDWPENCDELGSIQLKAKLKFMEWEKQQ
ncbi:hypothetical protein [Methylobacter sp.]|uniref:hypothetical protein n=1 Tax=Methylobacter sp. TaxID=2051955 RepID=UPI0011FBEF9C|nr:hypothetical protein [Methylobacter sp.]TAK62302.1 MAG: hypothetical protein EPO18_10890 [Methylobacter sp.]